jgi:hypothetical protein
MKLPIKTAADVPPGAAAEFAKAPRPEAVAEAEGTGYAMTKKLQKAAKSKGQFGLPASDNSRPMRMGKGMKG